MLPCAKSANGLVQFEAGAIDVVGQMVECGNLEGAASLMRALTRTLAGQNTTNCDQEVLARIDEALQRASKDAYGNGVSWR